MRAPTELTTAFRAPREGLLPALRRACAPAAILLTPGLAHAAAVNSGDTAFVLVSAALVLLMTPGLAFFYGGLVRGKNAVHTMLMSVACMAVAGITWALLGYSLAFGSAPGRLGAVIGSLSHAGLAGVGGAPAPALAPTIPHAAFFLFQTMFAVITPALVSGAVVERMRLKAFLLFAALFTLVVYAPVAHWVWAPGGFLRELGALDFAGGTVVHIAAAGAALVAAIVIGPRRAVRRAPVLPHNVPFALLGMGLLWFGWIGFNAGSALAADGVAAIAATNTFLAAAAAALAWALLELRLHGKMSGVGLASGAVAGLVAITPAAGFVLPASALLLGGAAGSVCLLAVRLRARTGVDDALDVFAIHGVAGILGALLTGVLCTPAANPAAPAGGAHQLLVQATGVGITLLWTGVASLALLLTVSRLTPLRAEDEDEALGLDLAEAGERAYGAGDRADPVHAPAPHGSPVLVERPEST